MTDWAAVANVGTAGGTALLAVATFSSTRSANRAARSAERSLLEGLRPLLVPSRWQDPVQKVRFIDDRWVPVDGGRGVVDVTPEVVYLVMSLRNVGRGLAILHGWDVPEDPRGEHGDPAGFRRLTRDISVSPGDTGFWQGGARDRTDPLFGVLGERAREGLLAVDLLYGDSEGGQRTVSRFAFTPVPGHPDEGAAGPGDAQWALSVSRHWRLDGGDFREGAPARRGRLRR